MGVFDITIQNLHQFCYHNLNQIQGAPRGVVLNFHGLGFSREREEPWMVDTMATQANVACLFPYCGPWSWMNDHTVAFVNSLVELVFNHYQLPADTPIVSTGGSMGGLAALVYSAYAQRTPCACAADCPVCDLPYHFTERPDLPRSLRAAFGHYPCGLQKAMESASPVHLVDRMPRIPYLIHHGQQDTCVSQTMHSQPFVQAMQAAGHDITYRVLPGMDHCEMPPEQERQYHEFIIQHALGR